MLQLEHGLRIEKVWWPLATPLVLPSNFQVLMNIDSSLDRVGTGVSRCNLLMKNLNTDTAKLRSCSGEVLVNDFGVQANSFKTLRSAVGRNCGDSHFGHDLENALAERLNEVICGLIETNSL